jgi:hypothetical protein
LLIPFLIATALIAGLILLRMFAERRALRARIRKDHTDTECEDAGCFRGCSPDRTAAHPDSVSGNNETKRSAYHAP